MTALLDGLAAIVDPPDAVIAWKPARNRRSPHWPMPDGCDDLASFEVLRHLDLAGLGDDGLRDQLALGRFLLGSLLARSGSTVAEAWLRGRLVAIATEIRERMPPVVHERQQERRPAHGRPRHPETPSNGFQPIRGRSAR